MKTLHGVASVILTPFTPDGDVDMEAFVRLVRHLLSVGVHGITLFGLMTEFHKLTDAERAEMAAVYLDELKGSQAYSLISVTEHSTDLAVRAARRYEAMGADFLMLLPPHFMNPPVEAIREHIERVLRAVSLPVLIQYAPIETGSIIPVETMAAIANRYPNARFKIEPNPPMDYIRALLRLAPDATIMLGYAGLYMLDVLEAGGKGTIPGTAFIEPYVDIHESWMRGDKERARAIHARLLPYIRRWMTNTEYMISVEKRMLVHRGLLRNDTCRLPSFPLTEEDDTLILQFLEDFAEYCGKAR